MRISGKDISMDDLVYMDLTYSAWILVSRDKR